MHIGGTPLNIGFECCTPFEYRLLRLSFLHVTCLACLCSKAQSLTEPEKTVCTWFGEIPSCCSLTALIGLVWVLLNYVLQTIFSGPVDIGYIYCIMGPAKT